MQKKSIKRNYLYNLSYQILILLLPLVSTPYVSRVLGPEGIGEYSYTQSIVTYFILFGTIGINMYAQREIAYVQEDKAKRSKVFLEIIVLRLITISISLILFLFMCIYNEKYRILYIIQILDIIATALDISWFFQGIEEFRKTVIRNIFVKVVGLLFIFLFIKTSSDLYLYVFIRSTVLLIGNLSLWVYIRRYISMVGVKNINIIMHIKPTIILFIPQIASQVYTVLDKTMLGSFTSAIEEVGYYEQSQKITRMALAIVTSLGAVMLPRMANSFANNDIVQMKRYMMRSFQFVYLLAFPIMFGIIAISSNFVPWFFGQGYERVAYIMKIISPIIVAIGVSNVVGVQYLLPTKKQGKYTISVVIGALVNFILNIFLISKYGSIGAAIATVSAELIITSIQVSFIRKEIDVKKIIRMSKKYLLSSFFMFIVVFYVGESLSGSLVTTIVQIILGATLYVILLITLRETLVMEALRKIKVITRRTI